jgi:predicted outer membrane protein
MNEITVTVQNAIINIEDREKVEQQINEIAKKYSGYLPTADTLTGDKATRASLRKVRKALDDKRKNVKSEYNEPLKEFENWVKKSIETTR